MKKVKIHACLKKNVLNLRGAGSVKLLMSFSYLSYLKKRNSPKFQPIVSTLRKKILLNQRK